ncbi:TPA: Kae1-associated serine/threonine protein kinase [Candidatus Woesearchaeota archaeon]|nr:Kae1-associated serine/threonine protein kinase [Candidatus Woesearchaeota archaeon]
MKCIAQGAEAKIFQDNDLIIKERIPKPYRLLQLDRSLRQFRTRREAKILQKLLEMNFPSPRLRTFSDKTMDIQMELIPGKKIKQVLEKENLSSRGKELGKLIAQLHQHQIIHGDLTTSNMIFHQHHHTIYLIDFGLSFFSEKDEDKAVDLYLLERGLLSTHPSIAQKFFAFVLEGYTSLDPHASSVLERLNQVRKRGRNKK